MREAEQLEDLRRQLGDAIWTARLETARHREAAIQRVQRAVQDGLDFQSAVAQHASEIKPATLSRWTTRWRRDGLIGLIGRWRGRVPEAAATAPQLSLDFQARRAQPSTRSAPPDAAALPDGSAVRSTSQPRTGRWALPLVKWSGSKAMLASRLAALAPASYRSYHEPFVGGGALFFTLRPARSVLSDLNGELINLYLVVQRDVEALIAALAQHRNTPEHFRVVRGIHPDSLPPAERAARTLFLNRTCFNGLYRVNRSGLFNVPYGSQQHTTFFHPDTLRRTQAALAGAIISCRDFATALDDAASGDFVYLDPPYVNGLRGDAGFVGYQAGGFSDADDARVAQLFGELDRRGCHVMLSSADSDAARARYQRFRLDELSVQRQIGGHAGRRGKARELVVRNY